MAVMDASAVVEVVLRTPRGLNAFESALSSQAGMHAPHILDIEVAHVLRRLVLKKELSLQDAGIAIGALPQLEVVRHSHLLLLPRIWELRDAVTAYDAAYVALAEILDVPLLTCDAKLSRSHGHRAKIILLT
jgi:predicted nucleic acid-binding protein